MPNLLKPVVFDHESRTRIILVRRQCDGMTGALPAAEPVELPEFDPEDVPTLFRQYLRFHRMKWDDSVEQFLVGWLTTPWRPDQLRSFRDLLKSARP